MIVAAVLIGAAFGAYALLNRENSVSGTESSMPTSPVTAPDASLPNDTAPDTTGPAPNVPAPDSAGPDGPPAPDASREPAAPAPEGVVSGTAAGTAEAAAAGSSTAVTSVGFPQLSEDLASTSVPQGSPESLTTVAVTNGQTEGVPIAYSGFQATLADGSAVAPTNAADIVLAPGTTTFLTLNFPTGGQAISSIGYSAGGTAFSVPVPATAAPEGAPVTIPAPGGLVPNTDIGFVPPTSWQSDDRAAVLLRATNNNPSAVPIGPSDFWIDLGNGTWVQASGANDVPAILQPGVTETFLIGFSNLSGASPGQVWYWPGGPSLERIGIGPAGGGAGTAGFEGVTAYTARGGVYRPQSYEAGTADLPGDPGAGAATATFDIPRDDAISLISFVQNGETKYLRL